MSKNEKPGCDVGRLYRRTLWIYPAAVVLVLLAAAAAGILPAWRASRTDPIEALRTS